MSTQTAATRVQLAIRSLSASWPSDPLRPTLQFADAIKAASDRIVPSKLSKVELDKAEQTLASLERLAANSAKLQPKVSNRPRYSASPEPVDSESSSDEDEDDDDDDGPASNEDKAAAMLEALEKHQAQFLSDALPAASGSGGWGHKGKAKVEVMEQKSVWDMGMDDFDDAEAESEDESEEEDDFDEDTTRAQSSSRAPAPVVVAFAEPRLSGSPMAGGGRGIRDFMSAKVKNSRPTFSVADLANAKPGRKGKAKAESGDAEEEAHLASLDSSLSDLIRPLTSATGTTHSQLPSLLASLPTAPTKVLKGLTPLPSNAPRTLRRGQAAANLKRARLRDEAQGVSAGAKKRDREATTLKEKRHSEGSDKRQRGMGGAIGVMTKGGLRLSKDDIDRGNGVVKREMRMGGAFDIPIAAGGPSSAPSTSQAPSDAFPAQRPATEASTGTFSRAFRSRRQRPCDGCRKAKTRCAIEVAGQPCMECLQTKRECTFVEPPPARKRNLGDSNFKEINPARTATLPLIPQKRAPEDASPASSLGAALDTPASTTNGAVVPIPTLEDDSTMEASALTTLLTGDLLPIRAMDTINNDPVLKAKTDLGYHRQVSSNSSSPNFLIFTPPPSFRISSADVFQHCLRDVRASLSMFSESFDEDAAVRRYFKHSHSILPVLPIDCEPAVPSFPPAVLSTILATSLIHDPTLRRLSPHLWSQIKAKRIGFLSLEEPKLSSLAVNVMILQARPCLDPRNDFMLLSATLAHAQLLGLHLDPSPWMLPQWEKDLRVRLWWSVRIHESFSVFLRSTPSHLQHGNSSVPLPTKEGRCPSSSTEPSTHNLPPCSPAFFYLCRLAVLISRFQMEFCTVKKHKEAQRGRATAFLAGLDKDMKELTSEAVTNLLVHPVRPVGTEALHGVGGAFEPDVDTLGKFSFFVNFLSTLDQHSFNGFWLPYCQGVLLAVLSGLVRLSLASPPGTSPNPDPQLNPTTLLARLCLILHNASEKYQWDVAALALTRAVTVATRLQSLSASALPGAVDEYRAIINALERRPNVASPMGPPPPPTPLPLPVSTSDTSPRVDGASPAVSNGGANWPDLPIGDWLDSLNAGGDFEWGGGLQMESALGDGALENPLDNYW
ncbi:hypothetical protein MNV49_004160 [Pseudohyphozyma bogoriensis]|nr:hypothetical protein MNV49_004160 [Pseudohyphozyma bogoriensis]